MHRGSRIGLRHTAQKVRLRWFGQVHRLIGCDRYADAVVQARGHYLIIFAVGAAERDVQIVPGGDIKGRHTQCIVIWQKLLLIAKVGAYAAEY